MFIFSYKLEILFPFISARMSVCPKAKQSKAKLCVCLTHVGGRVLVLLIIMNRVGKLERIHYSQDTNKPSGSACLYGARETPPSRLHALDHAVQDLQPFLVCFLNPTEALSVPPE